MFLSAAMIPFFIPTIEPGVRSKPFQTLAMYADVSFIYLVSDIPFLLLTVAGTIVRAALDAAQAIILVAIWINFQFLIYGLKLLFKYLQGSFLLLLATSLFIIMVYYEVSVPWHILTLTIVLMVLYLLVGLLRYFSYIQLPIASDVRRDTHATTADDSKSIASANTPVSVSYVTVIDKPEVYSNIFTTHTRPTTGTLRKNKSDKHVQHQARDSDPQPGTKMSQTNSAQTPDKNLNHTRDLDPSDID